MGVFGLMGGALTLTLSQGERGRLQGVEGFLRGARGDLGEILRREEKGFFCHETICGYMGSAGWHKEIPCRE